MTGQVVDGLLFRLSWDASIVPKKETNCAVSVCDIADRLQTLINDYFSRSRSIEQPHTLIHPAVMNSGSEFRRSAMAALSAIPYGETCTYSDLATQCGHPGAARAVGAVCRSNPIPILIPCHRVVSSNGIGGYAGLEQRIELKRALLAIESSENHLLANNNK